MKIYHKWKFTKSFEGVTKRVRIEKFKDEGIIEEPKETVTEAPNDKVRNVDSYANAEMQRK